MKIFYIAGDGRSGSTILESILANNKDSIGVGECNRFWLRYYEQETLCGCGEKIESCELWNKIDKVLKANFNTYNPEDVLNKVRQIMLYKNFEKIPLIVKASEWEEFCSIIKMFYISIFEITGKQIIIDSSKSPSWAYFLKCLDFCELKIIHLERNLEGVANSWKKKIVLPEYTDKTVYMPVKSSYTILKSWAKVKYLSSKLSKDENYLYVSYEDLCRNAEGKLNDIKTFLNIELSKDFIKPFNHGIGGNPVRSDKSNKIKLVSTPEKLNHLNAFQGYVFALSNKIAKAFLK